MCIRNDCTAPYVSSSVEEDGVASKEGAAQGFEVYCERGCAQQH